ncbi:hypothetical protein BH23GEM6_BH23GEM6_25380 [soil metagenome]
MIEYRSRRSRSIVVGLCILPLFQACATAPSAAGAASLTPDQIASVAEMIRVEDARSDDVRPVLAAASDESPWVRARAALSLGRLRHAAERDVLLRLLQDADTAVAATAAFSLGQIGDTTAVASLTALMNSSGPARWTVAAEAAYALGKLRSAAAADALVELLSTSEVGRMTRAEPHASALLATWRHPRPADASFITRWVSSPDPELRWRAAYALVRRPTPAATTTLQALLADPDSRVRALGVRGLTAPLADSAGIGSAALPALISASADPDYTIRINAVRTLGTYRETAAVQALVRALQGRDRHLSMTAAESLGRLGAAAADGAPALRALAVDTGRPPAIRQAAIEALARVDVPSGRAAAEEISADPEWRVRVGAARALAFTGTGDEPLARLRDDNDPRVATATLQALLEAAGDNVAPLRSILIQSLGASDVGVRTAAIGGIGRLADPATLPLLLDAYDRAHGDTRIDAQLASINAIAGLERAGAAPARAFFARFARSPDYLVRIRVAAQFGAAAVAWGDPLPLQPRRVDHAHLASLSQRRDADPIVRIETEMGHVEVRLFAAETPLTVANFLDLARAGYFDGQEWPRVVPNFVVQGGDPRGDTSGGPGYSIRDEFTRHRYGTGTLGMALSGPDTGGSQWFITHSPQPHLDGAYTIFGEVLAGQGVTERILPGDRINRVHVVQ